jgi:hypothetical protein
MINELKYFQMTYFLVFEGFFDPENKRNELKPWKYFYHAKNEFLFYKLKPNSF